jgi:multidrug efflux pump subunit AcrB
MNVLHAAVYAARRRVVPILITSVTTIGGLFSLAVGLGGKSLLWGPVAASIVWGLGFSTLLTLFVMPLIYWMFMRRRNIPAMNRPATLAGVAK